jgi:hypothetical protein
MSLFEFIVGMISVIFALAVARLFSGVSELIQNRGNIRFALVHAVWVLNLFLLTFLHWWTLWAFRDLDWNFLMFFYSLIGPSLMFFASTMISPRIHTERAVDLSTYFLDTRRYFLPVFVVMSLFFIFDGPLFGTEKLLNTARAAQILVIAIAACGLLFDSSRVQKAISVAVLTSLVALIVFRFFPG